MVLFLERCIENMWDLLCPVFFLIHLRRITDIMAARLQTLLSCYIQPAAEHDVMKYSCGGKQICATNAETGLWPRNLYRWIRCGAAGWADTVQTQRTASWWGVFFWNREQHASSSSHTHNNDLFKCIDYCCFLIRRLMILIFARQPDDKAEIFLWFRPFLCEYNSISLIKLTVQVAFFHFM
jgi:hypothetical protein